MKNSINESFKKVVDNTFENIDGILVQKGINKRTGESGFIWGGVFCHTTEDVKQLMKYSAQAIQLSIVNPNGEVIDLPKFYTDKYKQGKGAYNEYKKDQE